VGCGNGDCRPLCLKFRDTGFWTATVLGVGIFSVAAGLGHVYEMLAHGNYSPDNAGPVMYMDLFYPLFLVILLWLWQKRRSGEAAGQGRSS
jgi:hypothetical protein